MIQLDDNEKKRLLSIFSANLPAYRKSMKLSQEEFGDMIGITRQTVSSIERGAYPLTWSIFLSCLFMCSNDHRARKLIFNSFAGESVILGYLDSIIKDGAAAQADATRGHARQIFYGTCTIKDAPAYPVCEMDAATEELFGIVSPKPGSEVSYLNLVFEEDRAVVKNILDEKLRKQMVICLEHRVVTAENQVVSVQCFIRRQKKMMKNGLFDITITQVSGEMFRRRQVSGLMEKLPVGVVVFDYRGKPSRDNIPEIYYANETFYNVIGHTAEQFASIHNNYLPDIIAPHDVRNVQHLLDPKHSEHQVVEADFRINRFDGSVTWVHSSVLIVSRSEEKGSFVSCTLTEITERVNAEMSMKYQLDRYRQMDDVSEAMQVGYDVEKDELTLPAQLCESSGLDSVIAGVRKEKRLGELVQGEDRETFTAFCQDVMEHNKNGKGEFRLKTVKDGYQWCRIHLAAISNGEGKVIYVSGRIAVIEEERQIRKERNNDRMLINRLASTDRLTGLYNRTAFRARIQELLKDPEMEPVHAIIYCDINDFSYINEKYGYPAGDRILRDFGAMFLRKGKRCFACRLHSDDFIVYVNGETQEQVLAKLRGWSKVFVEHQTKEYPGIGIQLTNGVYFLKRGESDIPLAMDNANLARKQAKAEQNKSYCICTEALRARRNYEQSIAGEIANAIKDNKIEVFLQPKFAMNSREIIGAEALARWRNDDGTYRSPADFVPILEKTGHITDLDFFIYTSVLQILRRWKKAGVRMIPISINFSNSTSINGFEERITRLAEQYGVDGRFLELEINECTLNDREKEAVMLVKLQNQGFRITLDDFGSGNRSLTMLINAPVNMVKINRTFLEHIGNSKREREYVRCMCEMIASVKKEAIFAGVETEEQVEFLSNCGFTKAQGYLFERPIPIGQFEEKYLRPIPPDSQAAV